MGALKNIRHEYFIRQYVRCGGNGAEAYRRTMDKYPWKQMNNPDYARTVACIILQRPDVQRRYEELRTQMAKRADITEDKILTDYQTALNMALRMEKPEAVIAAAREQARLTGLLRDRVESGGVGDFDNMESPADILEKVGNEIGPEAALALAKAFGMAGDEPEPDSKLAKAIPPSDAVN